MTLQSLSLSSRGFYFLEMEDLERRLKKLTEQTGYNLVQRNGQRIFGGPPPGWTSQQGPDRGTEVYCYKLPRLIFRLLDKLYTFHLFAFTLSNKFFCM